MELAFFCRGFAGTRIIAVRFAAHHVLRLTAFAIAAAATTATTSPAPTALAAQAVRSAIAFGWRSVFRVSGLHWRCGAGRGIRGGGSLLFTLAVAVALTLRLPFGFTLRVALAILLAAWFAGLFTLLTLHDVAARMITRGFLVARAVAVLVPMAIAAAAAVAV